MDDPDAARTGHRSETGARVRVLSLRRRCGPSHRRRTPGAEVVRATHKGIVVAGVAAGAVAALLLSPAAGQRPAGDTRPEQHVVVGGCDLAAVLAFHACASG